MEKTALKTDNTHRTDSDIYSVLRDYFGYERFRASQEQVIRHVLAGGSTLTIMPTGMGKSLCYQVPACVLPGLTLVISPLIALMKDQVDALVRKGIDAAYINSSLTAAEREERYENLSQGAYKLLYVTPERFRKKEFVERITRREISLLAVDEAHCISEWGHDFRPDYTRLQEFRALLGNPTTIALTATATPDVQEDILYQLGLDPAGTAVFHEGIDRPNLRLEVREVWGNEEKLANILELIKENPGSGIVYFSLIKTLQEFSELLQKKRVPHLCYHGKLETQERRQIQDWFMHEEGHLVLATNAFGMGIDKENIRFVIHAEIPGTLEAYYQEIGRAGRDGNPSVCALLYDEQDLLIQMEFLKWNNPDAAFYQRVYDMLHDRLPEVNAYGMEWLKEQLHFKNRRDFRLETALGMLDRYGVIEGHPEEKNLRLLAPLPETLTDADWLAGKLQKEQKKLYALVQYAKHQGDLKAYIHDYFGLPTPNSVPE